MNIEILKYQARRLFVVLNTQQNESAFEDKRRFNRLYPLVGLAFRRYMRRINLAASASRQ